MSESRELASTSANGKKRLSIIDVSREDFHSQFTEEDFLRDLKSRYKLQSAGSIQKATLTSSDWPTWIVFASTRGTTVFVWGRWFSVDDVLHVEYGLEGGVKKAKSAGLQKLDSIFSKIPNEERSDVIAVALQELPHIAMGFHSATVHSISKALSSTHRVFCWVRKWSQMMIVFIRRRLSFFTSHPEYQFIASSRVAKPFRTKGAIGICFRLMQTSIVLIACHLTHGKLRSRIVDYHKISRAFDFISLRASRASSRNGVENHFDIDIGSSQSTDTGHFLPLKRAANVFWFGDLNFRVLNTSLVGEMTRMGKKLNNIHFRKDIDYQLIMEKDELNVERSKGTIFEDFQEAIVRFPPTHKFLANSSAYNPSRVPSYTDRVLYWSRDIGALTPFRYDCVWEMTLSDHKPVYCTFRMRVIDKGKACQGLVKSSTSHALSRMRPTVEE